MVQIITQQWGGWWWGGWGWSYTPWNWIDITNNEISVDTSVVATQTDLANGLEAKQNVISDLGTIRSNASAGKAASDTISTYWNIVTHNVSEFATSAQWALADTAVQPWDNVSDLNNDSWFITSADLPDLTPYQLKSNMVTSLNSADNDHYPTAKAVKDAISTAWGWDVSWPSSSVDGHLAVFDWNTGKLIKDWWAIPTPTTVVDNLSSSSTTSALSANQGRVLNNSISTINWKIPSTASTTNQLADKDYVNDSINSVTAFYITKNAAGDQFATRAELVNATTYYSWGEVRVPTRNDYAIVLDDETHNDEVTRYIYNNGWEYQYTINESPLTQAQLNALNSWITSWKVTSYDGIVSTIATYWNIVTHNTSEFATSAQWALADSALQPNDNISELNNDAWYITWVNWGSIGWTLSNQVDLNNALWAKANDDAVVKLSWAQTIAWTKTFSTSPVVPSKTASATNTWTAIATEAQVYKKQDTLVSWTSIKTINNTSVLWSWNIAVQPTLVSGTNIKTVKGTSLLGSGNVAISEFSPSNSGSTDQVLTKTASWYQWATPSWWDVMVSSQPNNILTSWMKIWAWTQANYEALSSYDNNTVYLTIE